MSRLDRLFSNKSNDFSLTLADGMIRKEIVVTLKTTGITVEEMNGILLGIAQRSLEEMIGIDKAREAICNTVMKSPRHDN